MIHFQGDMSFNDPPFYMAFKVNHIVAGPKRGRPSHISPVQTFLITLSALTLIFLNINAYFDLK